MSRHSTSGWRPFVVAVGLIVLALSGGARPANAQAIILVMIFGPKVAAPNLHFAIKAGVNASSLTGLDETSTRWGFNYGVVLNKRLDEAGKWWLMPELAPLSPKGAGYTGVLPAYIQGNPELDDILSRTTKSKVDFNFIDIPVVLSYRPDPRFRVGAGPYVGYRTSAKSTFITTAPPVSGEVDVSVNSSDYYQRWDFGAVLEAGFSPWGSKTRRRPTIFLRYQFGFTDLLKDNPGEAIRNRTLQISAVFPFVESKDEATE